jgi:ankyrin repeat protein
MPRLIEAKVDVNKSNKTGRTPLHYASSKNQIDVILILIM